MDIFLSQSETLAFGAPVVRLFRLALGRDPDPIGLRHFVVRLRRGDTLEELAQELTETEEFRLRHGSISDTKDIFVRRVCLDAFGSHADDVGRTARFAAANGADAAEVVAMLANSARARSLIPVLPGVAPGAPPDDALAYRIWCREYDTPSPEALAALPSLQGPSITVTMIAGDVSAEAALRTAESLRAQVYGDWTLYIAARLLSRWPTAALHRLARDEPRVVIRDAAPGDNRATLLNRTVATGRGDLVCFLAPGDCLAPSAFYEAVTELSTHPDTVVIHSDEDELDGDTRRAPKFKPDVSPDAMLVGDAIGQLALYRVAFFRELGGLQVAAAPHEMYDLACRTVLAAKDRIRHVPAVLCHRGGIASDWPAPATVSRPVLPGLAGVEADGAWPRARFVVPQPAPLVSVIIPTRDHPELLAACVAGILERTAYRDVELLVVDNGSREPAAMELLSRIAVNSRVKVLSRDAPFNFAALNNEAAAAAQGNLLLLLNDDVQVLEPNWLNELVAHAVRPDVGAVGARLLYPDGTVQHAGMLLGPNATAIHVGRGAHADDPGYLGQLACTRELSAVTGACLMIRRDVWTQVGGMDERLAVTWNDVDLCLRVRAAGLRVLWTPHATLLHHEGATRGSDASSLERQTRFEAERALIKATWGDVMESDPFLNANLVATEAGPLALTRPRRRRPWN